MRHNKAVNHLGRKSGHRKALLSNMACSLIMHKRINTTVAKAKALKTYVEPLITKCKEDTTHNRRVVFSYLKSKRTQGCRPSGRIHPRAPHRFPSGRRSRDGADRACRLQRGRTRFRSKDRKEDHPSWPQRKEGRGRSRSSQGGGGRSRSTCSRGDQGRARSRSRSSCRRRA